MIFAFLFGLSMDYEVFILARMREEYDRTGSTETAVIQGIGRTGRLVTSAALILFLSFTSMASGPETDVKMMATGLAAGILLDATVIRALIVPAVITLMGRWNWWLPSWPARLLRRRALAAGSGRAGEGGGLGNGLPSCRRIGRTASRPHASDAAFALLGAHGVTPLAAPFARAGSAAPVVALLLVVLVGAFVVYRTLARSGAEEVAESFARRWSAGDDAAAAGSPTLPSRLPPPLRANRLGLDGADLRATVAAVEESGGSGTAQVLPALADPARWNLDVHHKGPPARGGGGEWQVR